MSLLLSLEPGGDERGVPAGARPTIRGSVRDSAFNQAFTSDFGDRQPTILGGAVALLAVSLRERCCSENKKSLTSVFRKSFDFSRMFCWRSS